MKRNIASTKERQSNFEVLRIFAIFMIVCFHFALKGGWDFKAGSVLCFEKNVFLILGELGVNIFMLITGYFMCEKMRRKSRAMLIWLESCFYTFCAFFILHFFRDMPFTKRVFMQIAFPEIFDTYWYVTAYLVIYLISPYLNIMICAMDKTAFRKFLGTTLLLWCAIPSVFQFIFDTTERGFFYTRLVWLVVVYCFGAYIKRFGYLQKFDSLKKNIAASFAIFFIMVLFLFISNFDLPVFFINSVGKNFRFWPPNEILMFLLSVSVFNSFRLAKIGQSAFVNNMASTTLGVYMIHDGPLNGMIWHSARKICEKMHGSLETNCVSYICGGGYLCLTLYFHLS